MSQLSIVNSMGVVCIAGVIAAACSSSTETGSPGATADTTTTTNLAAMGSSGQTSSAGAEQAAAAGADGLAVGPTSGGAATAAEVGQVAVGGTTSGAVGAAAAGATTVASIGGAAQSAQGAGGAASIAGSSSGGMDTLGTAGAGVVAAAAGSGSQMGGTGNVVAGNGGAGYGGAGYGGVGAGNGGAATIGDLADFSFFVTSLVAMRELSGNQDGFGGDLTYGEADGLSGADKICAEVAERSMPGSSAKQWRAFLSVASGPDGSPVNAIARIGQGPWYDRLGRLIAENVDDLLNERPLGADSDVAEDLPNEDGEPNHMAGGVVMDNHDVLTGSNQGGELEGDTCADWTSTSVTERPMAGHSWVARSGNHWIQAHQVAGCLPSVVDGEGSRGDGGVGDGGGYGGIYCFALTR